LRSQDKSAGDAEVTSSIITVATMKGGSGKSTVASCLAVHWHLNGRRVAIIDADPQRSVARLAARERALGGVPVVEDATRDISSTAHRLCDEFELIIVDTPGFHSNATLDCLGTSDFVLIPVKPSPFDVDRMLDTLNMVNASGGARNGRPNFCCLLTQTTRDSVIGKHIRSELVEAGFPVLTSEMRNRIIYAEAALWGATPTLVDRRGPAALDIAAVAGEVEFILHAHFDTRRVASA
jgi:chromosome partitioning protein